MNRPLSQKVARQMSLQDYEALAIRMRAEATRAMFRAAGAKVKSLWAVRPLRGARQAPAH